MPKRFVKLKKRTEAGCTPINSKMMPPTQLTHIHNTPNINKEK